MLTIFHRQLTLDFLRNFVRALLALMVALGFYHAVALESAGLDFLELFRMILGRALPMALLVASLFTVGYSARHHELTALKAAGWPLHRIVWPLLLVGLMTVPVSALLEGPEVGPNMAAEAGAASLSSQHAMNARPLVSLLAVVLGISLGATRRPRTMYSGFLQGALILVFFFVVSATALALGRHGGLPPILAGWLPLLLFSGLAWVFWGRAAK